MWPRGHRRGWGALKDGPGPGAAIRGAPTRASVYACRIDRGCGNRTSEPWASIAKLEDRRREAAEKEVANRRATDAQVLEDVELPIAAWNERQAKRMPMLFSPTIGASIE
jgi:hypothetical protein